MATARDIIQSGRYDLRDQRADQYEDPELLEYLNRSLVLLENTLLIHNSDWLHNTGCEKLAEGALYVPAPARCLSVRAVWVSSTLTSYTDLTFSASDDSITTAGENFDTDGFEASDRIGITGTSSNDTESIGILTISSIDDNGGTNNRINVYEDVIVDEGSGDASGTIVKVENNYVTQKSLDYIWEVRKDNSAGTPYYWAHSKGNVIFERPADQDYGIIIHYNQRTATLGLSSSMPHNDEFNDLLRQGMVFMAENRGGELSQVTTTIYKEFERVVFTKMLTHNFVPKTHRLDF